MSTNSLRYERDSEPYSGSSVVFEQGRVKADPFWRHWADISTARWEAVLVPRIVELTELPPGWDGYQGRPIGLDTCMFAIVVLNNIMRPTTPCPQIVPTSSGAIQLEWHERGIDLEVKIAGAYQCEMYFQDLLEPESPAIEEALGADLAPLLRRVDDLAGR